MAEPWLRGTLTDVDPVRRQVLHALELAGEDVERWCAGLTGDEMELRPYGLAPVGFHLRHMARSLDRLLTYAEGSGLDAARMAALGTELVAAPDAALTLGEFRRGLAQAAGRVLALPPEQFADARFVGRERIATTLAGLLIHCAEHTQRHVGQAITTAKLVRALSSSAAKMG